MLEGGNRELNIVPVRGISEGLDLGWYSSIFKQFVMLYGLLVG